ncbi:hypothetical protein NX059_011483 [Plenodomus lindquistii]|nr:hypothetical protein NX059_011483 [Plenodomus lindquistii]
MCDTTFTFGQRGSHFFQCPSQQDHTRLSNKLVNLLSSPRLKKIYAITLGYEDSFLLTWRDTNNKDRIDYAGLPTELLTFITAQNAQGRSTRNVPKIQCVLGPYNESWFVHDGDAYSWMNLPTKLLQALQSRIKDGNWIDRPRIVALGAGTNFVLLTEKHDAIWHLEQYRTTSQLLEKAKVQQKHTSDIRNLVLHPYRYDSFVAQSQSGILILGNLPPPSVPGMNAMIEPIKQDSEDAKWEPMTRTPSVPRREEQRRPSVLQQRASMKREWNQHNHEFSAQAKGMKVSLSLSVSVGGIARMLGGRS